MKNYHLSATRNAQSEKLFHTGQILLDTEGTGDYQEKSKPMQLLHKGDVIKALPNVDHWHGESADSPLTPIAINPNTENGIVVWLDRVTEEECSG